MSLVFAPLPFYKTKQTCAFFFFVGILILECQIVGLILKPKSVKYDFE